VLRDSIASDSVDMGATFRTAARERAGVQGRLL